MPIYSYRCETCGHQQDVLQKMSDPLLVTCPACGASTYRKQVTAAGFQLKGSGWYVTDFRNPATKETSKAKADGDASPAGKGDDEGASKSAASDTPSEATPAPATESKNESKAESKTESSASKASPPPASGNS
ncbi:MAG: FmdB family zinc ribbon protein [Burkholderiaceae bacterium]